jgi:hypothetical protein
VKLTKKTKIMKKELFTLLLAFIAILFSSCSTSSFFYQVYRATPMDEFIQEDLSYEDENCRVRYSFWGRDGDMAFAFHNKTDKNIYLHLDESFFVVNGIAYDYFKNRVFTTTTSHTASSSNSLYNQYVPTYNDYFLFGSYLLSGVSKGESSGVSSASGQSIGIYERAVICIPPFTYKIISEYNIKSSLYRDCDLLKYPTKKEVKTKKFSKEDTPFIFGNRLAYSMGNAEELVRFTNDFYVSEITNYPRKAIIQKKYKEYCGQKQTIGNDTFTTSSSDKFYIRYDKADDDEFELDH